MEEMFRLNAVEARVLGVLIEKALSTPDAYPLTLNSLVNGANQKVNRDPVLSLSEEDLWRAVQDLVQRHLVETVFSSLSKAVDLGLGLKNYALVTVHRMENIFSRQRLEFVLTLIERIARDIPVVFVQHPPTVNQMVKFGLQERLERLHDVTLSHILSHAQFIHLLNRCEFVVTDGGSIQEESYYLGKPCLLLRKKTERMEGIGRNVVLGECTLEAAEQFIRGYPHLSHARDGFAGIRPSQEIIDHITSLGLA